MGSSTKASLAAIDLLKAACQSTAESFAAQIREVVPQIGEPDRARVEQMADNFAVLGYALLGGDGEHALPRWSGSTGIASNMYRLNDRVRRSGQESVDKVRARDTGKPDNEFSAIGSGVRGSTRSMPRAQVRKAPVRPTPPSVFYGRNR
jgi:hypothetical protein